MRSDVNVIMFDEPLTVIDPHLKWVLRSKLKELHHRIRRTMIYVTHDQTEALTFADQVVVMKDGEIVQIGTPVELFERPTHTFVGHFIGSPGMNVLPCEVKGGKVELRRPCRSRRVNAAAYQAATARARARRAAGIRELRVQRHSGRYREGRRCRPLPHRRDAPSASTASSCWLPKAPTFPAGQAHVAVRSRAHAGLSKTAGWW